MTILISSPQNDHIKAIAKLEKRSERDARRVTVVEGVGEVRRALAKGIVPSEVYLCEELLKKEIGDRRSEIDRKSPVSSLRSPVSDLQFPTLPQSLSRLETNGKTQFFTVTPAVFAKIAYRGASGGVLLVIPYLDTRLATLPIPENPFLVVIEGVEKPGNLGAILRSADAAGVDGVIVAAGATDIHNPNVVRASLGTLFTQPVVEATLDETVTFLRQHKIQIVAADPAGKARYTTVDLRQPSAIVMGSEAFGLSAAMRSAADPLVSIPMHGMADSLNLATATALLLYEVVRQRGRENGEMGRWGDGEKR